MNKNIRLSARTLSTVLAIGIALSPVGGCYAEKGPKEGTVIPYSMEDEVKYNKYIVKAGDNLSHISEKICRYFGEEITAKYWPVVAFLNEFPRIIRPGDEIIFPATFEEVVSMYTNLRSVGWMSRYIQANDIYGKYKEDPYQRTLLGLLREIYGNSANIDLDFAVNYVKKTGKESKVHNFDGFLEYDEIVELTEWIPTLDELGYTKTKKSTRK